LVVLVAQVVLEVRDMGEASLARIQVLLEM
jgi:hypothetical protein